MKKNEKLFNYTLSVIFILLIVVVVVLLIYIGRYVLSDSNSIGNYVTTTKDLISDASRLSENVEAERECIEISERIGEGLRFNSYEDDIESVTKINMPNTDKGILTLVFDSDVYQFLDFYYIREDNLSEYREGYDVIYQKPDSSLSNGKIFAIEEEFVTILNVETKEIIDVSKDKVMGKIIIEHGEGNQD